MLEPFQSTAKNPRKILLGTPRAKIGKFWEYYSSGQYKVLRVRSDEVGRISTTFLASQLDRWVRAGHAQEYLAEFQDPTTAVFSSEMIESAVGNHAPWQV